MSPEELPGEPELRDLIWSKFYRRLGLPILLRCQRAGHRASQVACRQLKQRGKLVLTDNTAATRFMKLIVLDTLHRVMEFL